MFLLVPAYPGCPGSKAVKRSLLLLLLLLTIAVYLLVKWLCPSLHVLAWFFLLRCLNDVIHTYVCRLSSCVCLQGGGVARFTVRLFRNSNTYQTDVDHNGYYSQHSVVTVASVSRVGFQRRALSFVIMCQLPWLGQ